MRIYKSARIFPIILLTILDCIPPGSAPDDGGNGTLEEMSTRPPARP